MRPLGLLVIAAFALAGQQAAAEPALWKIQTGTSVVYLFGTTHLLGPGDRWWSKEISDSLDMSQDLWIETLPPQESEVAAFFVGHGFSRDTLLSTGLSSSDKNLLRLAENEKGASPKLIEHLEPWAASVLLQRHRQIGSGPPAGVEPLLETEAASHGIPVKPLETFDEGMHQLADLPLSAQMAMLLAELRRSYGREASEPSSGNADWAKQAWLSGDFEAAGVRILDELRDESPILYDTLVAKRNARWSIAILGMLQDKGVHFVAVGAGHFAGPDSLLVLLKNAGFTVTRQ